MGSKDDHVWCRVRATGSARGAWVAIARVMSRRRPMNRRDDRAGWPLTDRAESGPRRQGPPRRDVQVGRGQTRPKRSLPSCPLQHLLAGSRRARFGSSLRQHDVDAVQGAASDVDPRASAQYLSLVRVCQVRTRAHTGGVADVCSRCCGAHTRVPRVRRSPQRPLTATRCGIDRWYRGVPPAVLAMRSPSGDRTPMPSQRGVMRVRSGRLVGCSTRHCVRSLSGGTRSGKGPGRCRRKLHRCAVWRRRSAPRVSGSNDRGAVRDIPRRCVRDQTSCLDRPLLNPSDPALTKADH